jgi:hypothetical protein
MVVNKFGLYASFREARFAWESKKAFLAGRPLDRFVLQFN